MGLAVSYDHRVEDRPGWEGEGENVDRECRCEYDVLNTMMSRINTMNPTTPPPLPYFQALPWFVASMGAAMARAAKKS